MSLRFLICLSTGGQIIEKRGLRLEYLTIVNGETLRPVLDVTSVKKCVVLVAAYAGDIRLIDNIMV